MTTQEGPAIRYHCFPCKWHDQKRYVDSEADEEYFEHECTHPRGPKGRIDPENTPNACPFLRIPETPPL